MTAFRLDSDDREILSHYFIVDEVIWQLRTFQDNRLFLYGNSKDSEDVKDPRPMHPNSKNAKLTYVDYRNMIRRLFLARSIEKW